MIDRACFLSISLSLSLSLSLALLSVFMLTCIMPIATPMTRADSKGAGSTRVAGNVDNNTFHVVLKQG